MANRNWSSNRRANNSDYGRGYDRPYNNRSSMNPWQGNANSNSSGGNVLPLGATSDGALSLASNLIANFLQQRQNNVPSLLDMPVRRDFGNFDRSYGDRRSQIGRMGSRTNQGSNFNRRFNTPGKRSGNQNFQQGNKNRPYKKSSESNANKSADSKASDEKATENGEKTETNGDTSPKKASGEQSTPYDGIMAEYLQCHVCEKKMWDGRSFQNHINGRAHNLMMEKNRESYALTADAMRQELKIAEMKRGRHEKRDYYCAMCDLYAADASKHRLSLGHRRLKRYLHPSCNCCRKENASRIELDEHRLTPQHMKTMQEKNKEFVNKPKGEAMMICTKEQELIHVKYPKRRKGHKENLNTKQALEEAKLAEEKAKEKAKRKKEKEKAKEKEEKAKIKVEGEEGTAEGEEAVEKTEEGLESDVKIEDEENQEDKASSEAEENSEAAVEEEPKNFVLDFQDDTDLTGVTEDNIPYYDIEVGYGKSFISDFNCKQCKLCNKILDTEETAEVHLKTWKHYRKFSDLVREKAGLFVKKASNQKRNLSSMEGGEEEDSKRCKFDIEDNPKAEETETTVDDGAEGNVVKMDADTEADVDDSGLQNGDGEEMDVVINAEIEEQLLGDSHEEEVAAPVAQEEPAPAEDVPEVQESPKKTGGRPRGRGGRRGRY